MKTTTQTTWTTQPLTHSIVVDGKYQTKEIGIHSASEVVDFGVTDDKGRAVGGFGLVESCEDGSFRVSSQAMRAGKRFGAIPRSTYHRCTLEEAQAIALSKVEAARKRQVKQWTKPATA